VQDVPTAQGPTVVTSMRLTPSSSYAASEVGPPNLILKGLGALSEKDAVVVGPLHVKGLSPYHPSKDLTRGQGCVPEQYVPKATWVPLRSRSFVWVMELQMHLNAKELLLQLI